MLFKIYAQVAYDLRELYFMGYNGVIHEDDSLIELSYRLDGEASESNGVISGRWIITCDDPGFTLYTIKTCYYLFTPAMGYRTIKIKKLYFQFVEDNFEINDFRHVSICAAMDLSPCTLVHKNGIQGIYNIYPPFVVGIGGFGVISQSWRTMLVEVELEGRFLHMTAYQQPGGFPSDKFVKYKNLMAFLRRKIYNPSLLYGERGSNGRLF